ncbi:hypothetical protein T484DRAFT_1784526, partial [Baffinella frigidus]
SSRCARVAEEAGGVAISGSQRRDDIKRMIATAEDELSTLSQCGPQEARTLVKERLVKLRLEETVLGRAEVDCWVSGAGDLPGQIEIGTKVKILFEAGKWYKGVVEKYTARKDKYTVIFPDGYREKIRIPDPDVKILRVWEVYVADDDDTPSSIATAMGISVEPLLKLNKDLDPRLVGSSKFWAGTRVKIPLGTKAAYLSRGGPVCPEAGVSVPREAYVASRPREMEAAPPASKRDRNGHPSQMSSEALQQELRQRGLGTEGKWGVLSARLRASRNKDESLSADLLGSDPMDHDGAQASLGFTAGR